MHLERYEVIQLDEFSYRFFSEGTRGRFKMHVHFARVRGNTYNLGFGVVDDESEWIDDLFEVRNGDSQKILATVASVTLSFLEAHPERRIFATGSTIPRTRLYQMGINRVLPALTGYTVTGCLTGDMQSVGPDGPSVLLQDRLSMKWQPFEKGVMYNAFMIYKS